ncbi:MAG: hypothetical protein HFE77_01750 [Clostridiales bacterium]|nr:hypothetical protein [Clostridiales bacterium]
MAFFKRRPQTEDPENKEVSDAVIGAKEIKHFNEVLKKYKEGKGSIERRVVDNEEWWKLHQWQQTGNGNPEDIQPKGAYLWNTIEVKHADVTAAYPEPSVRPRNAEDEPEAKKLSSVLPVVLEQNDFRRTWSEVNKYKLKQGTGVYGVFWDAGKHGGLGDISICKIDLLRIFWEPGIQDIQHSRYVFLTDLVDIDLLEQQYPEHKGKLRAGGSFNVQKYLYDDHVDDSEKTVVIDVYYKVKRDGRTILHYCKYAGNCVLYATENDQGAVIDNDTGEPQGDSPSVRGLYDHGLYPFVFDPLFEVEGSVAGYGYIDIGKSMQMQIDLMDQAFIKSTLANCTPRYLVGGNLNINEAEFADFTKPFVRAEGLVSDTNMREIPKTSLSGNFLNVYQMKVNEIKEVLGNRDVANGGTTSGVTAASAIATLQEVSGRMSKDSTRDAYNAYRQIVILCIELIRQFYDLPRTFRILGDRGTEEFIEYTNQGLGEQAQTNIMGVEMGLRLPVFDVEVSAQNATEYTKQSQNEMALQFFNLGFFNPQLADQALACLDIMDFDHKEEIEERVQQNGLMFQQLQQLQQMVLALAQKYEPALAAQLMETGLVGAQPMPQAKTSFSAGTAGEEHAFVKRARQAADEAARPEGAS